MNGKLRRDSILDILKKQGYSTVSYLCETLHYSSATINRDLNLLESQKLIKRSYGGAELVVSKSIPLLFRYNKAKKEKRHLAIAAAKFVEDGDTIFIDGSTTAQYMMPYLINKKNLTVITANLAIATFLSEYPINVLCLGGKIVEAPYVVGGDDAVLMALRHRVDKIFFATAGVFDDGRIGSGSIVHSIMINNAKKTYYLVDSGKLNRDIKTILCDFSSVSCVISDFEFSEETKKKYQGTEFICVEKQKTPTNNNRSPKDSKKDV